jgi:hypothetical protein
MREARQSKAKQIVGAICEPGDKADRPPSPVPSGCGKMRRLRCCAPRHRSTHYDLRRAPSIHPHFASNAIRVGPIQRFLIPETCPAITARAASAGASAVPSAQRPSTTHGPYVSCRGLGGLSWIVGTALVVLRDGSRHSRARPHGVDRITVSTQQRDRRQGEKNLWGPRNVEAELVRGSGTGIRRQLQQIGA